MIYFQSSELTRKFDEFERSGAMIYQYILFDLDGTLTDPGIGITNSVMYALEKFNIKVSDRVELYPFIGPPLLDSFEKYYGFTPDESKQALLYYREYFVEKGMFENTVYDGVEDMLSCLLKRGKKLYVATSKPEVYSKKILDHFGLSKYFEFIGGSTLDEKGRIHKSDVIKYVLENARITDTSSAVMIGDRHFDIDGAKICNLDSVGVLYGYGDETELKDAGATYIAEKVGDIERIIP